VRAARHSAHARLRLFARPLQRLAHLLRVAEAILRLQVERLQDNPLDDLRCARIHLADRLQIVARHAQRRRLRHATRQQVIE
jgi:hypothetical protein